MEYKKGWREEDNSKFVKDEHRRLSNNMDQTSIVMYIRHGGRRKIRGWFSLSDRVCLQGVGTKLFGSAQSQPLKKNK